MLVPVIALVGRPNVGKSTLFNRLTKTQNALVADFPGLTRDRQYGDAHFHGKSFIVVDTGGIGVDDLAVDNLMSRQSTAAIDEADQVFFIVDGRDGLTGIDQSIATTLRRASKKVHLLVNKVEGLQEDTACAEFQSLGFENIHPISAAHGSGIQDLLREATADFPEAIAEDEDGKAVKISFVGRPNVGKSTLINRILGEERVVVYDMPGTTRDSISVPFERDGKAYVLVDTAGVRRRSRVDDKIEKFSIIKTLQSIRESHVCLLLIDAREGVTDQDLQILSMVMDAGKALVIAVNKWDGLDADHREHVMDEIHRRMYFASFAKIKTISALHGSGVGLLFKDIDQAYGSAMQPMSTPRLTRLLQDLVAQHAPPLVHGRRIKLRYAHAGGHNPPVIVIHGNQLDSLPESYIRYLKNAFIEHLGLIGTPLELQFKGSDNPYKNKRNKLTPRQEYKRKRLIRHVKKNKR